jgi:uncharacterized phage protein gp47/JayE
MPFSRPTLADLVTRIRADFRSRLGITGQLLRRAMADVLAATWAGATHLLHGHLEWLGKQIFPATSEREFLLIQAAMYGITPTAATFATGTTRATGVNGTVILVDTVLVRDDGVTYKTTVEKTITGGIADLPVTAVLAGEDGNLATGEILTFESPIPNVDADTTVQSPGISGGNDEESTEKLRARLVLRLREPPEGGADQDYEAWALAVAGVTRVWVYRHENGLGTVVVRFVRDDESPIFPDAGEVTAVQGAIDAERPTTAEVTVVAPTAETVNFTISITPDTSAIRNAVQAELEDLFARDGEPGDGAGRGTIFLSRMQVAIGVATGVEDFDLTVPAADVVPALGKLPVVGTITWT